MKIAIIIDGPKESDAEIGGAIWPIIYFPAQFADGVGGTIEVVNLMDKPLQRGDVVCITLLEDIPFYAAHGKLGKLTPRDQ